MVQYTHPSNATVKLNLILEVSSFSEGIRVVLPSPSGDYLAAQILAYELGLTNEHLISTSAPPACRTQLVHCGDCTHLKESISLPHLNVLQRCVSVFKPESTGRLYLDFLLQEIGYISLCKGMHPNKAAGNSHVTSVLQPSLLGMLTTSSYGGKFQEQLLCGQSPKDKRVLKSMVLFCNIYSI